MKEETLKEIQRILTGLYSEYDELGNKMDTFSEYLENLEIEPLSSYVPCANCPSYRVGKKCEVTCFLARTPRR